MKYFCWILLILTLTLVLSPISVYAAYKSSADEQVEFQLCQDEGWQQININGNTINGYLSSQGYSEWQVRKYQAVSASGLLRAANNLLLQAGGNSHINKANMYYQGRLLDSWPLKSSQTSQKKAAKTNQKKAIKKAPSNNKDSTVPLSAEEYERKYPDSNTTPNAYIEIQEKYDAYMKKHKKQDNMKKHKKQDKIIPAAQKVKMDKAKKDLMELRIEIGTIIQPDMVADVMSNSTLYDPFGATPTTKYSYAESYQYYVVYSVGPTGKGKASVDSDGNVSFSKGVIWEGNGHWDGKSQP